MSDAPEKHEKIFDPTPRRIQKAREEGNVFRSREMVSVGMLAVGLSVLAVGMPFAFRTLKHTSMWVFSSAAGTQLTVLSVPELLMGVGWRLMIVMVPFALALVMAAVGLNVMQSGWNMTLKPLAPKLNRVSPAQGFKRLFSSKGLFETGKALIKIAMVAPIAYGAITGHMPEILMMHTLSIDGILGTVGSWVVWLLAQLLLVLFLLAGVDFAYEKWKYKEDLKMTAKEIKDESKDSEGDPHVKGKRRQLARELARRPRLDHAVLKADVVITNPTHYAVALYYDPDAGAAPRVLAKGIRKRALRIKEIAAENDIPTVEDRPLARALYASVDEEQEIPEELYPAVAAILAEVYRKRTGGYGF